VESRPRAAWIGDRLVPWAEAAVPIEDRGLQFAESVYELLPVTARSVRLVVPHLQRLRAGATVLGLAGGVPTAASLTELADLLIEREEQDEGLLYLQVTGGTSPRRHVPHEDPAPTLIAYLRGHRFPRDPDVVRGLAAITLPDTRWAHCDLKTTMLLPAVLARRAAAARGAGEAILLGPGDRVLEGAASNVFALSNGRFVTPARSDHMLPGTMRSLVYDAARELGLPVETQDLPLRELLRADEVFVTATSTLALPVLRIDGMPIADACCGPVARAVAGHLRRRLELE
jgi:D-alanine transaminase